MNAAAASYAELHFEVEGTLDRVGHFLASLCESASPSRPSSSRADTESGEAGSGLDRHLGASWNTFYLLKQRHTEATLTVAVTALTKSGKSTLLNALIGRSCLPANNVPETARITRVIHTPAADNHEPVLVDVAAEGSAPIVGDKAIRAYLSYVNKEVRASDHSLAHEAFLDLHTTVEALKGAEGNQSIRLHLLDTPGPNEAGKEALRSQVERLLDSVDAVVYLLDYTKLKTAEEAAILRKFKEINPQLMQRLSQRLFFVVNKADHIETSEGLDAEATRLYVADLVTRLVQDESFQLRPEQVLLLSAQTALLSRLMLSGIADHEATMRFGRLAFGSRMRRSISPKETKEAARELLADSGLQALEDQVVSYLYTHAGALKMLAVLDDIYRMLQQVQNVAAASKAALSQDVAKLQEETKAMQEQLLETLTQFDVIQKEAEAVEGEVVDEVRQRMQHLREDLFRHVTAVLNPAHDSGPSSGRWQVIWNKARSLLGRHAAAQQQQEAMQATLRELHSDIHESIEAEVHDFWHQVEAATNDRQRLMLTAINAHLAALSRRIETAVGELLDVHLEPVPIRVDPPNAQEFHESLQELFAKGINRREVTKTRERQEDYTEWVAHYRGLCRTGKFYVGMPATRTVQETYAETVYELAPTKIQDYFIALVDGMVDASIRHVRSFVHQYLALRVDEARGKITEYGERYTNTMLSALTTCQQGEAARSEALVAVTAHLTTVQQLLHEVSLARRHAEQLFPGHATTASLTSEMDEMDGYLLPGSASQHAQHAPEHHSDAGSSQHLVVPEHVPQAETAAGDVAHQEASAREQGQMLQMLNPLYSSSQGSVSEAAGEVVANSESTTADAPDNTVHANDGDASGASEAATVQQQREQQQKEFELPEGVDPNSDLAVALLISFQEEQERESAAAAAKGNASSIPDGVVAADSNATIPLTADALLAGSFAESDNNHPPAVILLPDVPQQPHSNLPAGVVDLTAGMPQQGTSSLTASVVDLTDSMPSLDDSMAASIDNLAGHPADDHNASAGVAANHAFKDAASSADTAISAAAAAQQHANRSNDVVADPAARDPLQAQNMHQAQDIHQACQLADALHATMSQLFGQGKAGNHTATAAGFGGAPGSVNGGRTASSSSSQASNSAAGDIEVEAVSSADSSSVVVVSSSDDVALDDAAPISYPDINYSASPASVLQTGHSHRQGAIRYPEVQMPVPASDVAPAAGSDTAAAANDTDGPLTPRTRLHRAALTDEEAGEDASDAEQEIAVKPNDMPAHQHTDSAPNNIQFMHASLGFAAASRALDHSLMQAVFDVPAPVVAPRSVSASGVHLLDMDVSSLRSSEDMLAAHETAQNSHIEDDDEGQFFSVHEAAPTENYTAEHAVLRADTENGQDEGLSGLKAEGSDEWTLVDDDNMSHHSGHL